MKYEKVKMLSNSQFKRLIGIQPSTFLEMLEVLESSQVNTQRGRPSSLSLEDQLLMTLSYWREYRTTLSCCYELWNPRINCVQNYS